MKSCAVQNRTAQTSADFTMIRQMTNFFRIMYSSFLPGL